MGRQSLTASCNKPNTACNMVIDSLRRKTQYYVWCVPSTTAWSDERAVRSDLGSVYPSTAVGLFDKDGNLPITEDVSAASLHSATGLEDLMLIVLILIYTLYSIWRNKQSKD